MEGPPLCFSANQANPDLPIAYHPKKSQTGDSTDFVDPAKVILMSDGRLDATFGGVPNIGQLLGVTGSRVVGSIPRLSSGRNATDLHVNAWVDNSGENLTVGVASRPLMIPTAIDTYGCIDTGATL